MEKHEKLAELESSRATMNAVFINKVRLLRDGIQANNTDPLKTLQETMQDRTCVFELKPVRPEKVLEIILGLKNPKSTGIDNIDTYVIKLVSNDILPGITHIVNLSIRDQTF